MYSVISFSISPLERSHKKATLTRSITLGGGRCVMLKSRNPYRFPVALNHPMGSHHHVGTPFLLVDIIVFVAMATMDGILQLAF